MTIKDIAEMAHVSKGTVSRVMNGAPGVGDETRHRVLKLIQSLDFHPNASARGLAARRTNTLGFVIPHTGRYSMTSMFWPVLQTSIVEQAAARGINVLLSTARSEDDIDSAFRSILKGRRIDGAIIGAEQFGEKQLAELLLKSLPFVTIGRSSSMGMYSVDVDNESGAYLAVEHLITAGHRSIAMLAGPERHLYMQDRVRGFTRAMADHGLSPVAVSSSAYRAEDAFQHALGLLTANRGLTALFVAAGDLVIGTMKACAALDLSIPRDLSLVSFDDHPFFEQLTPAVTVVAQPVAEMGAIAVDTLLLLMDGTAPRTARAVLPPTLVARESSGPPGAEPAHNPSLRESRS
jgi:DNA-binding LacI/PurR family transcriptional regulator